MARKSKMTKERSQSILRRSSWSTFASIWQGKDRPVTPWIISRNIKSRSSKKKRREPRVLRKRHY
ncbi:MAG: hypothetical protein ACXAEF_02045 [Candidatus Thorarchaeota archaeon]